MLEKLCSTELGADVKGNFLTIALFRRQKRNCATKIFQTDKSEMLITLTSDIGAGHVANNSVEVAAY